MGICSFCNQQETESYWKSYCEDCAMLRRMLLLHDSKECVGILKRCLIRNQDQISNKIKLELKNQDRRKSVGDESYNVQTRSNKKI